MIEKNLIFRSSPKRPEVDHPDAYRRWELVLMTLSKWWTLTNQWWGQMEIDPGVILSPLVGCHRLLGVLKSKLLERVPMYLPARSCLLSMPWYAVATPSLGKINWSQVVGTSKYVYSNTRVLSEIIHITHSCVIFIENMYWCLAQLST